VVSTIETRRVPLLRFLIRQGRTISTATSFNVPSNTFVGINRDCGRNAKAATLISGGVEILIVLRGKLVVCEKCDGVPRTFLVKFDTYRKDLSDRSGSFQNSTAKTSPAKCQGGGGTKAATPKGERGAVNPFLVPPPIAYQRII
jgi:hypothetical protein